MPHRFEHRSASLRLDAHEAQGLAETLKAVASPSRLRLLVEGPRAVDELAAAVELSPSATSHNLRRLRELRLVQVTRRGRHADYALHDHHVRELLAAIRHHHEHLTTPSSAEVSPGEAPAA